MLSIGLCAQLACIWEATARKPGNVHRYRDFEAVRYLDFLASAAAIAPVLETAPHQPVGKTILRCVEATRQVARTNTNLGILLLLTPLAKAAALENLQAGVQRILENLDVADARAAYRAIRLAAPGGLGKAVEEDVRGEPTRTLREVMALAADRDLIARQYADGYRDVFGHGLGALRRGLELFRALERSIQFCFLSLLAAEPDSLIARKRGQAEAAEASRRAGQVLEAGWPETETGTVAFHELDAWLCTAAHARNPGTTADLVAASLFVLLRESNMELLLRIPW